MYVSTYVLVQVEVPLNTAKKLILLSADRYDTAFSVTQYVSDTFGHDFLSLPVTGFIPQIYMYMNHHNSSS